jgi:DNA-binding GntR family transcriptional regulator
MVKGEIRKYVAEDGTFHQAIFDHCGNKYLKEAFRTIAYKVQSISNRLSRDIRNVKKSFEGHLEIYQNIKKMDIHSAQQSVKTHIDIHARISEAAFVVYVQKRYQNELGLALKNDG